LARQLLSCAREETLDGWLDALPNAELAAEVRALIEPQDQPLLYPAARSVKPVAPMSLTYRFTARRPFEVSYWQAITPLAQGKCLNNNNADGVRDATTQALLPYHGRHLDDLGDYLLGYYARRIAAAGLTGKALAGALPFRWRTDFDFSWMGGWLKNQEMPAE